MKKLAKEGLYLMDTSSWKNWTSFRAYRRRIGASMFKSRSPGVDSQVEEMTPSLRNDFLQNCDLCRISSGVDSQNWTSRLVAWVQKDHRTWLKRFFFRSRLARQEEPTHSLRQKLVQNYVRNVFTQQSTLGQGRVDSRPETRFLTESLQKDIFFRSRLSEVTSRLGVGLAASTTIFLVFSTWANGLQRLFSLLQRSTTVILTSKRIKWSVDQFIKGEWWKVVESD